MDSKPTLPMKFIQKILCPPVCGFVILLIAGLAPHALSYWWQSGYQLNTYYGVSIGPLASNSPNYGGLAIGTGNLAASCSLAVGRNLSSPSFGIAVGDGAVAQPSSTARHFSAGGSNSNPTFQVYGDRVEIGTGYQIILESAAGDVPSNP